MVAGSDSSDTKVIGGKTPEESRPTSTTSSPPSEGQQKLKDPASGLVKKAREGPVGSLVAKAESKTQGRLGISVYLRYFNAWGSFYILPILLTAFVFVERGFQQVQNWWISVSPAEPPHQPLRKQWTNARSYTTGGAALQVWSNVGIGLGGAIVYSNLYYFTILTIIAVISVIGSVLKTLVTAKGANAASRKLHQQLLDRVLSLPMSFHDTQVPPPPSPLMRVTPAPC